MAKSIKVQKEQKSKVKQNSYVNNTGWYYLSQKQTPATNGYSA